MIDPLLLAPLPQTRLNIKDYTYEQSAAIAALIVDQSDIVSALHWSLTSKVGRPLKVSWRTLLITFITAGIMGRQAILSEVALVASELYARNLIPTPVSYDQLYDHMTKLSRALRNNGLVTAHDHDLTADPATGEVLPCPHGCTGGQPISPERFAATLLFASAFPPGTTVQSASFAIDSTDAETWARRRSWRSQPDIVTEDGAEPPALYRPDPDINAEEWPKAGPDGRWQHTLDPDARSGFRSGKNMHRSNVFVGYDEHIVTPVPELGDAPLPHLALGLCTAPAGSSKASAGLAALDGLAALTPIGTVLADRGYTYLKPESWALQLVHRNITTAFDLHTQQRGEHPGPIPGTIWVDGGLFSSALPERLRNLPGFTLSQTPAEKAELHELYDQRAAYAFATQGPVDPQTGAQRVRGPALRGILRCIHDAKSMRLPLDRPLADCPPRKPGQTDAPCGCSKTKVLALTDHVWERQLNLLWGTTAHAASYNRRSGVESYNSEARTNRGIQMTRGFTRVFGTMKHHILLTCTFIGINVRKLREWNITRLQGDPWLEAIGDHSDPDWQARHGHRKRRTVKKSLHLRVIDGTLGTPTPGIRTLTQQANHNRTLLLAWSHPVTSSGPWQPPPR